MTETLELGVIDGPLLVFGGPYGNLQATRALQAEADGLCIPATLLQGVNVEALPKFPGKLGSMTPKHWYLLPAGELEPHHGKKLKFPLMIRAFNVR